jgi:hypothetical protein
MVTLYAQSPFTEIFETSDVPKLIIILSQNPDDLRNGVGFCSISNVLQLKLKNL